MKVLAFSSCYPSSVAPTEGIFLADRLTATARLVDLEVVHPVGSCPIVGPIHRKIPLPSQERVRGVTVYHRPFAYVPGLLKRWDGWFYYRGLAKWLERYCRDHRPELLDAHFVWPDGVGVCDLARRVKLPYVVGLHGTINPRYPYACFRKRMARAIRGAEVVFSVSRPMAELAIKLGADPSRVRVIVNGVDTRTFRIIPRQAARQALGLPTDRPIIVCVASLKGPKGQLDLLEAMGMLGGCDAQLILVGALADRPIYMDRLRGRAGELGLTERVTFAGGVPREAIVNYFNAADLSVLPSHSEGCPNVVLESLACGTPVVATAVGGIPDHVRSGVNGLLVPPRAPSELAQAIAEALARDWPREALRESVAGRSWDHVAAEMLEVFRQATGRGAKGASAVEIGGTPNQSIGEKPEKSDYWQNRGLTE